MNCQQVIPLAQAYSDSELDLVRTLELEQHLSVCPNCSQAHQNIRSLKALLSSADLYSNASDRLKRRVLSSLREREQVARRRLHACWEMLKLVIPIASAALIAFMLIPAFRGQSADDQVAREITSSHVRSLMVDHRTDVTSSDQHTVKPWFQGKLDFTPPVIDPSDRGFPLVGGRLDYLDGRQVAALVYQRHQHVINLFVWPSGHSSNTSAKATARQGFNLIHWSNGGMVFWAVSDLNVTELTDFAQLMK